MTVVRYKKKPRAPAANEITRIPRIFPSANQITRIPRIPAAHDNYKNKDISRPVDLVVYTYRSIHFAIST